MDEGGLMHEFEPLNQLIGNHESRFQRKSVATKLKQVSETRAHQLHCHEVRVFVLAVAKDLGKALFFLNVVDTLGILDHTLAQSMQKQSHIGLINNQRE